jgi:hypothetical protein
MMLPETRYARNNGLHVAYQLVGNGPVDVVLLTQWFSNIDSQWDVPPLAAFIRRLARFGRVLIFDKRDRPVRSCPGVGTAVHRGVDGRSSHRHG